MLGINPGEFLVLMLVVLVVVGPERLPGYAQKLGQLVREGRKMAMGLREQVRGELGPEFDEVDWRKLDPRQYDPRKIISDALKESLDDEPEAPAPKAVSAGGPKPETGSPRSPGASRPSSAASPAAAAAAGGAVVGGAAAASTPAAPESEETGQSAAPDAAASDVPLGGETANVPQARTATGAAIDLEAT